ncbi:hypothetical protein M501DRAFT_941987 [Patellaria atrata CBS 101060]|uniref:C2H2-type domain-containing protein n=1 Tax=Patellaria atrata CBS 101060 TaxID=1346257 RepID=A0A9P4S3A6_9PEZI|nr:hypothetical protein M501DRAFT_941987 [Patellaria atrata CBS 101060]
MFSPPRRGHSYKRTESPERNEENKMICTRSAKCSHLTFDRKCEWNKHMDKHDRPYKCKHQGCEKIQGFTYSGGLLRHQREVHKLYGGTRQSLFCPYNECKRSSGQGFTRKENLHEHIRRVHRKASGFSDEVKVEGEVAGALVASPTQADEELSESERPGQKRQRLTGADPADLRAEIKRLRRQNQEKDQRLLNLENAVMRLQQGDRG